MGSGWQHTNSFVIQFRVEGDLKATALAGRIEHVATNQTAHFYSLAELLEFVNQVLKEYEQSNRQTDPRIDHY